ncbi:MAG TPA: hypothetical protein PLV45_12495 [bacterium]|nr:hypothetical protein [bacterium]
MRWLTVVLVLIAVPGIAWAIPFPWQVQEMLPESIEAIHSDHVQGQVFLAVSVSGRLYRTQDSGDNWSEIATPDAKSIRILTRDPSVRTAWYSVTVSNTMHEIWYSPDNGTSWLFRSSFDSPVHYISPSPIAGGYVLAGLAANGEPFRLEKSEDGGRTWHAVLSGSDPGFPPVWHTTSVWQVHFGTYASFDYGETWTDMGGKSVADCGFNIPPSLFALTLQGLFQSQDNLQTWWPLLLEPVDFLSLNPQNANMIMTGRSRGNDSPRLYYSSDGGDTFSDWTAGLTGEIQSVTLVSDWMFFVVSGGVLFRYDERPADLDGTNRVDGGDLIVLSTAFGTGTGDPLFNPDADLNQDGMIDGSDLVILSAVFGHRFSYDEDDEPGDFPGSGE